MLGEKYPNYELTLVAQEETGEEVDWSLAKGFSDVTPDVGDNILFPEKYALHTAYPNPFNPNTTIMYDLPEASSVEIVIYNLLGREVWSWQQLEPAGYCYILWQGTDESGKEVSAGVYIYRIHARSLESDKQFIESRKMVLLK